MSNDHKNSSIAPMTDEKMKEINQTGLDFLREIHNGLGATIKSEIEKRFEGQPFNGKTVAEYFGCQAAAIEALAKILEKVISGEIVLGGEK